jgi:hypothetical protein
MSTTQRLIDLSSWRTNPEVEAHDAFTYYSTERLTQGDIPSIISFHGHPVPSNRVEVFYIGAGRQHLRCMVTFKRRKMNLQEQQVEEYYMYTLPAWQGTNDIIHLMEEAPGESYKAFSLGEMFNVKGYVSVVDRIRRQYSDDVLLALAPEVLFFDDPVVVYGRVPERYVG